MRKVLLGALALCCLSLYSGTASPLEVSGRVVLDGKGIAGVKVTDGYDIVLTDKAGKYSFYAHDDARFVYVSLPAGTEVGTRNGAPEFYKPLVRGSDPKKISRFKADFSLHTGTQPTSRHRFYVFADVQVYEREEIELCREAALDAAKDCRQGGVPAFGVSLGDIVGQWNDGLNVDIHQACAQTGFPMFAVIGNHDIIQDSPTSEHSKSVHSSLFGPTWYSFDFGKVHYVVLDDVFQYGRHYMGYLPENELRWLEKDLSYLEKGSSVVVFMHIPSYSQAAREGKWNKEEYNKIIVNRNSLYDLLAPFKATICSAHEHYSENYEPRKGLLEHVHAPLSGVFWQSLVSWDGIPWGYYVYDVDGDEITWRYKAVGWEGNTLFSAFPVGGDPMRADCVVANVWNYDPQWKVEWYENGEYRGPMMQYRGWDRNIENDVLARREREFKWKYVGAGPTEHLFCAKPSNPRSRVGIKVTDRFGNVQTWESPQNDMRYYDAAREELALLREKDGTFRTGKFWGGVWTRDISYSSILALAHTDPQVVKTCLRKKVDRLGRIIQDTGTGGSYPCSTDREVWTVAAWEVYLQTGEKAWLEEFYPIAARSLEADNAVVFNPESGLYRGESSFIDWREQSYPAWMEPGDIAQSECLGTNAVFYRALQVMGQASAILGIRSDYLHRAAALKKAINDNFWMEDKGYYSQFIYGRYNRALSPRSETLGEALCILWDIASPEKARRIFSSMSVSKFGPTVFWPQIEGMSAYHNNAIWPFVTAFYGLAAVHAGIPGPFDFALTSLFNAYDTAGSNMENMVASDGSLATCLNSPYQLWSVAGMMAVFQKGLIGMNFGLDGILFRPVVPVGRTQRREILGFRYRNAVLDIVVTGQGSTVRKCLIDGIEAEPFIPATLRGRHSIWIDLIDTEFSGIWPAIERMKGATPEWGVKIEEVCFGPDDPLALGKEQREAVFESVEPGVVVAPADGEYFIEFEYSNGNGDITTHLSCANRTLYINGKRAGCCVFPQRGDSWEDRGYSYPLKVVLKSGENRIELRKEALNRNMSIDKDKVIIHGVRVVR